VRRPHNEETGSPVTETVVGDFDDTSSLKKALDVRDIAAVAVEALTARGHEGQTYTITGPAAVTHAEMAAAK
jgi:hypothetical protein